MSANTTVPEEPMRPGLTGWVGHVLDSIAAAPNAYRRLLLDHPRRTVILTVLLAIGIAYPLINNAILQPLVRSGAPLPVPDDTTATFMLIFAAMAVGLNIVAGFAGLLDLGYVAFYALGAYTAAFFASPHWGSLSFILFSNLPAGYPGIHLPFFVIVPLAAFIAATFGVLLGAPTLRLRGDYLAIVTLGFGEITPVVFKNLVGVNFELGPIKLVNANLTGGAVGINPIDPPSFFGIEFGATSGLAAVYLGMVIVAMAIVVARNLERSRMGRAWMAIREDELAAEMMGVNTVRTKLLAFGLGASFAGVAGSLQASYLGATTSDFFQFSTSILVLIMIILGGIGNIWGVVVGALTLVFVDKTFLPFLAQRIQAIDPSLPNATQYNFLIFGIILVIMMRFRPEGFIPSRQRAAELHHAPPGQAIASAAILGEEAVRSEETSDSLAEEHQQAARADERVDEK